MQSYDYAHRKGTEEISWNRFASLAATLTESLAAENIDIVIGIARAGLFPATALACALRKEFFPVRVTRRVNDRVTFERPKWMVDVPKEVVGKTVAVVDEIADSGETLAMVVRRVEKRGALRVVSACLVSHTWAKPAPDHVALETDALVIFPWDKLVYLDGEWQIHPELEKAFALQKNS